MNKKNKILMAVLMALLSIFFLTKIFRQPALESNLNKEAFAVDTGSVNKVMLHFPESEREPIQIIRSDSSWVVEEGDRHARADAAEAKRLLQRLEALEPDRVVSRRKEKWHNYQVGDSGGIRLTVYDAGENPLGSWFVGEDRRGTTYMRPADDDAVYAVSGSLRGLFDRSFNEWRDKTLVEVDPDSVSRLEFLYPLDSGFTLIKENGEWMVDGDTADGARVDEYLFAIRSKELKNFADEFTPQNEPQMKLVVHDEDAVPLTVNAWRVENGHWVLSSSLQPNVYFSDSAQVKKLFPGKGSLLMPD